MTETFGSEPRAIEPRDETPHEHGGEQGWIERIAFNFFDRAVGLGGVVALEYRPGDRRATASLDVFLPGGRVATVMARDPKARRADLAVGRVRLVCEEQMRAWKIECRDVALVFPTAESANLARSERGGKAAPLELSLTFEAWGDPTGWATRRTTVDDQRFASIVSYGAFQQPGRYAGSVRVGGEEHALEGAGFRERWWGTRDDDGEAHWCAVAFGPDLSISAGRLTIAGEQVSRGWVYAGDAEPRRATDRTTIAGGTVAVSFTQTGGAETEARGSILATIPERPGDPWFRSIARFDIGGRTALGLVETPSLIL